MINIKKKIQNFFKFLIYKLFQVIYGKILFDLNFSKDSRVKIFTVNFEENIRYKIFKVYKGRLYTDRIQDTAIILDNTLIDGPSHQLRPFNNASIKNNIVLTKGTPRFKKKIKGTVLSLLTGGAGNNNFFHWLFDVLPRIGIYEKHFNLDDVDYFLIPSLEKKFQQETLHMIGINKNKLLSSKNYRHISTDKLVVTDHPYCINNDAVNDIQNVPIWISIWLKEKFLKYQIKDNNSPKYIYIDRSDTETDTNQMRKIVNEDEVLNLLKEKKFERITLSKLDFKDQIKLFKNAKTVIGLHGAGFSNLVFCESNTNVIEFNNSNGPKTIEVLAKRNNLNYSSLLSKAVKYDLNNQNSHIKIDLNDLEKVLDEKRK